MGNEKFYVAEVIRESDGRAFMLFGHHDTDPDDSWYFDVRGTEDFNSWAWVKSTTLIGEHTNPNQWIVDFVVPQLREVEVKYPVGSQFNVVEGEPHTLTIYQVDLRASLNLRYRPMLCQTFNLTGEPFVGAIKQGYSRG